jgi:hypothetical protein
MSKADVKEARPDGWLFRFVCFIAAIDRDALRECPRSDRLLASQLGLSLLMASVFIFVACCVSLFPTFARDPLSTVLVVTIAFLVAITVMLVDRLFFQADWFSQTHSSSETSWNWKRASVAAVRVALSLSIAFVIAGFIELSIFRSDIEQQIERAHRRENNASYDKIEQRKRELDSELAEIRKDLDLAEHGLRQTREKELSVRDNKGGPSQFDDEIAKERQNLSTSVTADRAIQAQISQYKKEAIPPPPLSDPGQFAEHQRALERSQRAVANLRAATARLSAILSERKAIELKLQQLLTSKRTVHEEDLRFARERTEGSEAERSIRITKYDEAVRTRDSKLDEYTRFIMAQPTFVQTQKGLFAQIVAYDELKQAWPIWWKSFWTKLFIMLIEAAPVMAKLLFSPGSVYAVVLARRVSEASLTSTERNLSDQQRIEQLTMKIDEMVQEREERADRANIYKFVHEDALRKTRREMAV